MANAPFSRFFFLQKIRETIENLFLKLHMLFEALSVKSHSYVTLLSQKWAKSLRKWPKITKRAKEKLYYATEKVDKVSVTFWDFIFMAKELLHVVLNRSGQCLAVGDTATDKL